jgi:chromosome transmission fidelity protein 1
MYLTLAHWLVQKAHNLPQAISNLQSCKLPLQLIEGASYQVQSYTSEYMDRLAPRHLQFLGHLKIILKAFQKSLSSRLNENKRLYSPSAFLCLFKLDRINLFPLLRYMADSKLSQKLLGFVKKDDETNKKKTFVSPMTAVETFLSKLNYENADGKVVVSPNDSLQFVVLNPAVASEDDLYHKPRALCLVGGTLQPLDVMVHELAPDRAIEAIKAQQAISNGMSFSSPRLVAFSCDHVVPKSNVLLQALTQVGEVDLDIRHKTRALSQVMTAIGRALIQIAKQVPHGMVIFLGSYKYEQTLVKHWQSTGTWSRLQAIKPIFREPKDSKQTDAVLKDYGEKASSVTKGALLLSVMGGKLSEGINFSNDLCRCVVVIGLPYPDPNDPLLQEKLKLMPNNSSYLRSLCLRSVNQSVGRAIRHASDYASIVLMDIRYPQQDAIAKGLPKWLADSTPQWRTQSTTLSSVERRIGEFFKLQTSTFRA